MVAHEALAIHGAVERLKRSVDKMRRDFRVYLRRRLRLRVRHLGLLSELEGGSDWDVVKVLIIED
uniref:WGS project CBMG000000000 data, contig CS5907-c003678 n=1 Tax=Fusarium acuminatum CS5907 TaxID=1318461 RepID=A0A090MA15_9HYPO|nr:unnamed protein product [Fusarium acuminatum CS5907]